MGDEACNGLGSEPLAVISRRFDDGDARMQGIETDVAALRKELEANTAATRAVTENTNELVELFRAAQGAFKVLNWLARVAKPLIYIVGLGTALLGLWSALRAGTPIK